MPGTPPLRLDLSAARLREVEVARRRLQTAVGAFPRDLTRIRALQGLPIEALTSARLLVQSREECLRAIIAFDEAVPVVRRAGPAADPGPGRGRRRLRGGALTATES